MPCVFAVFFSFLFDPFCACTFQLVLSLSLKPYFFFNGILCNFQVIFGGQLVTVAGGGCTYKGTNAMVVEGVGPCTAPVPEGYMVA